MEPLVFAIVAMRTLYNRKEPFVPEPLHFRRIDLGGLKNVRSKWMTTLDRTSDPQERLEPQIASWDEPPEQIVAHAPVSSDAIG